MDRWCSLSRRALCSASCSLSFAVGQIVTRKRPVRDDPGRAAPRKSENIRVLLFDNFNRERKRHVNRSLFHTSFLANHSFFMPPLPRSPP